VYNETKEHDNKRKTEGGKGSETHVVWRRRASVFVPESGGVDER